MPVSVFSTRSVALSDALVAHAKSLGLDPSAVSALVGADATRASRAVALSAVLGALTALKASPPKFAEHAERALQAFETMERALTPRSEDMNIFDESLRQALDVLRAHPPRVMAPRVAPELVTNDFAMNRTLHLARTAAKTMANILVVAESGTGKELLAHEIHRNSPVSRGSLEPVNCAGIPAELLESELFGHVKGAFTGAMRDKKGRFELADGGTLLLDEIGEMSPALQAKLLRVLQDGVIYPVGAEKPTKVNVRIIAMTHRDLPKLVREGAFRADLYYRLNVIPLTLPPLRERTDDIPLLINHFKEKFGKPDAEVDPAALKLFMKHSWPGNVRELENLVERGLVWHERVQVTAQELEESAATVKRADAALLTLGDNERAMIESALMKSGGVKSVAARLLDISRGSLHEKLIKYGIPKWYGKPGVPPSLQ